jgi:hypothetical protein
MHVLILLTGCMCRYKPGSAGVSYYPAVGLLLDFGADPNAVASNGTTPMSFALTRGNRNLHDLLQAHDLLQRRPRVPNLDPPSHPSTSHTAVVNKAMGSSSSADSSVPVPISSTDSPLRGGMAKRKLRSTPMAERAEKAGVADEMQPVPSDEDAPGYKQRRRSVQVANRQIVSRAEEKLSRV